MRLFLSTVKGKKEMLPNKTCPFCGAKPAVVGERSECNPCGYSVPTEKWLNQRDIVHAIGGSVWATNGHVIVADEIPDNPWAVLLSDLLGIMNKGTWVEAIPDGYCKATNVLCHRFKVGLDIVLIDAKHEKYIDVEQCNMKARAVSGGYIVSYYVGVDEPLLYVASLKLDTQEQK